MNETSDWGSEHWISTPGGLNLSFKKNEQSKVTFTSESSILVGLSELLGTYVLTSVVRLLITSMRQSHAYTDNGDRRIQTNSSNRLIQAPYRAK